MYGNEEDKYAVEATQAPSLRCLTLKEDIENQLKRAKAEVMRLEELSKLLEANPETNRILELLGRKY